MHSFCLFVCLVGWLVVCEFVSLCLFVWKVPLHSERSLLASTVRFPADRACSVFAVFGSDGMLHHPMLL